MNLRASLVSILLLTLAAWVPPLASGPVQQYEADLDEAGWSAGGGPFHCQLAQPIPQYGEARFEVHAGGELHFALEPRIRAAHRADTGDLSLRAPAWMQGRAPEPLGRISLEDGRLPVWLGEPLASRLRQGLEQGMFPTLEYAVEAGQSREIRVGVAPVGFKAAVTEFGECIARMAPFGRDAVMPLVVHFETAESDLSAAGRRELDRLLTYLSYAEDVAEIRIHGHADAQDRAVYNQFLSLDRAEAVKRYLAASGAPVDILRTQAHGESDPVADNDTPEGRAANRRVRVELINR